MDPAAEDVGRLVHWLEAGSEQQQLRAALALRNLATETGHKAAIREAGGVERLLRLLDSGLDSVLTVVAAETLACLAADDAQSRAAVRAAGGVERFVRLLAAGPDADCTHRALLMLRIVTDRETDRQAVCKAGGIPLLVRLLSGEADGEVTEYAAAALGNLAAGGPALKDAIREAGGIAPLVRLLQEEPQEVVAELAAVALRNLALQNTANRLAILAAGGLPPLLQLLSGGQERLVVPLRCKAVFREQGAPAQLVEGSCCFDAARAQLCLAPRRQEGGGGAFGCFARPGKAPRPSDRAADRFSLLRKLVLSEPDSRTLELVFSAGGAAAVGGTQAAGCGPQRRLERLTISPCAATELKGSIMRMLTRTHLEREFGVSKEQALASVASSLHSRA